MDRNPRTVIVMAERRKQRQQREIPAEWETLLLDQGLEYRGKPSATALAEKAGVSVMSALRVIHREPVDPETVAMVGEAVGDPEWVAQWVEMPAPKPFKLPVEGDFLDDAQRKVVEQIVRLFARDRMEVDGHGSPSKKMSPAVGGGTEPLSGPAAETPARGVTKVSENDSGVKDSRESAASVSDPTYADHSVTSGRGGRGSRTNNKAGKHGRKGNGGS